MLHVLGHSKVHDKGKVVQAVKAPACLALHGDTATSSTRCAAPMPLEC